MKNQLIKTVIFWLLFFGVSPILKAAQFTLNVPVNARYFEPGAEFKIVCGLYQSDQSTNEWSVPSDTNLIFGERKLNFDSAGQFVGLVTIEIDGVENPALISHYSCYSSASNSPNGPEFSCWSSNQAVANSNGECDRQQRDFWLNRSTTFSTGKTALPIQYPF